MLLSIVRQDLLRLPLPLLSHVAFAEGGSSYTFKSGEFQMWRKKTKKKVNLQCGGQIELKHKMVVNLQLKFSDFH